MIRILLSVVLVCVAITTTIVAMAYLDLASDHQEDPGAALYEQYGNRYLLVALPAGLLFMLALSRKGAMTIPQYRLRTLLLLPVPVAIWGGLWASAAPPGITILIFVIGGSLLLWLRTRSSRTGDTGRSSKEADPPLPPRDEPPISRPLARHRGRR